MLTAVPTDTFLSVIVVCISPADSQSSSDEPGTLRVPCAADTADSASAGTFLACTPFQHTQSTDTIPYPALGSDMRRREFITLIGCGAAAWSLEAYAQQSTLPVIGFLNTASSGDHVATANAFRQGLKDTGYVDG